MHFVKVKMVLLIFLMMPASAKADTTCTPQQRNFFRVAVDGKFNYINNNCHDHANSFCRKHPSARILMCDSVYAKSIGGHSVNLVAHPNGLVDNWCVVDPQRGVPCCFVQKNSKGHCGDVSLDFDQPDAKACYQKVCGPQAVVTPKAQCQIMPQGFQAKTHDQVLAQCRVKKGRSCLKCCQKFYDEASAEMERWFVCSKDSESRIKTNRSLLQTTKDDCDRSCSGAIYQQEGRSTWGGQ